MVLISANTIRIATESESQQNSRSHLFTCIDPVHETFSHEALLRCQCDEHLELRRQLSVQRVLLGFARAPALSSAAQTEPRLLSKSVQQLTLRVLSH